jgi:hypothetical protein
MMSLLNKSNFGKGKRKDSKSIRGMKKGKRGKFGGDVSNGPPPGLY